MDFAEPRENIPAEMLAMGAFLAFANQWRLLPDPNPYSRTVRPAEQQQPVDRKTFLADDVCRRGTTNRTVKKKPQ